MPFELRLRYTTPLTPLSNYEEVLTEFLRMIGYLPEEDDGRSGDGPVTESVGFRLVRDCFLKDPNRAWDSDELAAVLKTSKPTVYRHINRLKSLDLLEESGGGSDAGSRRGHRFRYGNIARAWDFTEANAQNALRRYRETVNHLQSLVESKIAETARPPPARTARGAAR